jgi:transcriptional regulator with XRE-family HTH domain
MAIGKTIALVRARRRLSQEALGRRAGVSTSTICKLEQSPDANPTVATLTRIATALGVSAAALLGDSTAPST